jgi:hypothetical protein
VGDAAGELDHLEAALDVAAAVGDHLPVLARQQMRQLVHVRLDQALELEHHPRAALRVGRRPGRLGAVGGADGLVQQGRVGEADPGLHLAGVGIEDVAMAGRRQEHGLAVDEVGNVAHGAF